MKEKIIDPWGSGLLEDYGKIVKDFGLEVFDSKLFPTAVLASADNIELIVLMWNL